jgi:tRNA pseudouridine55 synthase
LIEAAPRDGVLVVDKPAGPTSHDVVDRVRAVLGVRKAGHTGTLDPFATGVLPVCLGRATRLARFLGEGDKTYRATLRLGFATTTDDLHGEPLRPPVSARVEATELQAACSAFTGEATQLPPAFSAKRVAGRRAYELARRGDAVELPSVRVWIHRIDVLSLTGDLAEIEVSCSPGTYVRALARDIGRRLGVGGHLVALRRTRSGAFDLSSSVPLDRLAADAAPIPLHRLLPQIPAVVVNDEGLDAVRHGRYLTGAAVVGGMPGQAGRVRILDASGALAALGTVKGVAAALPGQEPEPFIHADVVLC